MSTRNDLVTAVLAASLAAFACAGESQQKPLLTQRFESRSVDQVDVGDFHFAPGQKAPVHTHVAPVFGYVSKGAIDYQVEGKAPVRLNAGDAFYEPVGPNIVHFDNASDRDEAVFTDFNFERDGEPFIVFPTPPTGRIDRRTFPSVRPAPMKADSMQVFETTVPPAASLPTPSPGERVYAYVVEGAVSVRIGGEAPIVYPAGHTFPAPTRAAGNEIANASKTAAARVVTFHLGHSR